MSLLAQQNDNGISFRADDFKLICVDLLYVGHGDVKGSGQTVVHLARVGANHFIPLVSARKDGAAPQHCDMVVDGSPAQTSSAQPQLDHHMAPRLPSVVMVVITSLIRPFLMTSPEHGEHL